MSEKVAKTTEDNYCMSFQHPYLLQIWDCQFSTCPSVQVPFTISNVSLTEAFNSTS